MDGDVLAIGLMLTGALIALAGVGYFAGRVAEEVAAAAAIAAGLGLAAVAWLPRAPPPPVEAPAPTEPLVLSPEAARAEAAAPRPGPPPPLPGREAVRLSVEAAEAEPNDTLPVGQPRGARGVGRRRAGAGDRDWFAVDVAGAPAASSSRTSSPRRRA